MSVALAYPKDVGARGVMNTRRAAMVAARRIGIAVEEYVTRRASGEKWCPGCCAWHPVFDFGTDRARSDGRASRCKTAVRQYNREYFYRAVCERCQGPRHAQGGRFCRLCYQERAAEREAERVATLPDRWIERAIRQQKREMAARQQAYRLAEREAVREARSVESSLLHSGVLSLDQPIAMTLGQNPISLGETVHRHEDDAAVAFEQEERSETLRRIAGDITSEDLLRMNESELDAIRRRLIEEGITPGTVQAKERDRLADPNRHSGASVPRMGRPRGGKRTRKQQQQVTRDHHVRELPTKAKKEHRNLRRARFTKSVQTENR